MKKLISVLLLLSLVFSLMTGVSISAFAAEDAAEVSEITADIEAILANVEEAVAEPEEAPVEEPEETPAEDVEETPAEDIEEIPVEDILESIVVEVEEAVAEISVEAPVLHGAAWTKAEGLVDGQDYIIGVDNGDGTLSVIKNDSGSIAIVDIASPDKATPDMIWTASFSTKGYFIHNGDTGLYYKNTGYTTTDTSKANWGYNGNLYYVGSGESYVVISGGAYSITKTASEASDIVLYTTGSAGEGAPVESPWSEDTALTAGKTYVIGIKNSDGSVTVLKDTGGAVVAEKLISIDDVDESMQWLYDSGLQNIATTADYLYYKTPYIRDTAAKNWAYADGIMSYDSKGTAYYLTVTADAASCGTDSAAASTDIVLWSMGEGSGDSGDSGDSGGSSSVIYTETKDIAAFAYIGIVADATSQALSLDMGWHGETVTIAGEAPNRTMTATKGTGASVIPGEGGVALTLEDPPGEINYLYIDETGALNTIKTGEAADYAHWTYSGTSLCYTAGGVTYYVSDLINKTATPDPSAAQVIAIYGGTEAPGGGGGGGEEDDTTAFEPVIVTPPSALPYVLENDNYAAPVVSIVAAYPARADYDPDGYVPEGADYEPKNLKFTWTVDGADLGALDKVMFSEDGLTNEITLNSLLAKPAGLYSISCTVSCDTWTVVYQTDESGTTLTDADGRYLVDMEKSGYVTYSTEYSVSFTVCKGILQNSMITFTDVHETWNSVGQAIANTIINNNGLIPSLILCTGDWINGHGDPGHDKTAAVIDRFYAQVSGIDIVFLTGNHETGSAATEATKNADLGGADFDGVGQVYDADHESASVGTSAENKGLVIFGVNYDSIVDSSYANVLPELEAFFEELEKDYRGELVIISCHSGLHVLGTQPESTASSAFAGGASYNINNSDAMVELINKYADTMDIMYFFGHDHSKGEEEFLLLPGTDIISTVNYDTSETRTQTLGFTYGHAGYIGSGASGTSANHYTLVTWDGENITRTMTEVSSNEEIAALTASYNRVAEQPAPEDPDDGNKPGDDDKPGDNDKPGKPGGETAPKTGDDTNIVLWIAVLVLCAGSLAILPRKKHN